MKKGYIILIISLFIVLLIPIAYYFMYALPQHNKELQQIEKDKLEYQKELDRLDREREQERIEQERKDKERKEQQEQERIRQEKLEKERNYYNCIETANKWREDNFKSYCELWYKTCTDNIDYWNNLIPNSHSYSECEDYKFKNNECLMKDNYAQEWKEWYERQLKMCDRYS